jgi:hypothetical protein
MGESLLSEIPRVESSSRFSGQQKEGSGTVIKEHVLEFLLTMNHSEEADNPVPRSVSDLVVHIIDTHVDQLQDLVTKLEMELDSVELDLDKGNSHYKLFHPSQAFLFSNNDINNHNYICLYHS